MLYPSIVECLARNAARTPDKLCMADINKEYSYIETWDAIFGLSRKLISLGLKKEDCVVVECNQSVDFLIWEQAIQLAGGIFVPLEKNAAMSRVAEIITETEARIHVSGRDLPADLAEDLAADILHIDISEAGDYACSSNIDDIDFPASETVSEILFSTGTTGKSKGIVLTHGNDTALAENVYTGVEMKPDNIEMIPMPTSHSHGLRRTYANLANGSSVVFIDGITLLKRVFKMMDEYKVTAMDLSPSMLSIIFKLSRDRLGEYADQLDYIQLGSAPLSEEDREHLARLLPRTRLYNFYGSTEAGCSCLLNFNGSDKPKGCIGKPAVNSNFIVVDENRKVIESSPDNLGFLASSGTNNMKEYFKAPELTKEAMPDGDYIYTKDLGYIDEDGYIYMLGRKDDVINYGGVKISPEEIESVVMKHPSVKDCACIPIKDKLSGQAPKLYIVLKEDAEYDAKEFKTFLAESIDANKQPARIEQIDEIPRTYNGKIIRKELIALNE